MVGEGIHVANHIRIKLIVKRDRAQANQPRMRRKGHEIIDVRDATAENY